MKVYSHWDMKKALRVCVCTLKKSSKRKKRTITVSNAWSCNRPTFSLKEHTESERQRTVRGQRKHSISHSHHCLCFSVVSSFLAEHFTSDDDPTPHRLNSISFSLLMKVCRHVLEVPTDSPAVSSCRYLYFFFKYRLYDFFSS